MDSGAFKACFVFTFCVFFLAKTSLNFALQLSVALGFTTPEEVHSNDVAMGSLASQITSFTLVYSAVYSGADQRKHQSSATLAFVRGIHRGPVNSPHKWPVKRKMFPFDDVIMYVLHELPLVNLFDHQLHCGCILTNDCLSYIKLQHEYAWSIKYLARSNSKVWRL